MKSSEHKAAPAHVSNCAAHGDVIVPRSGVGLVLGRYLGTLPLARVQLSSLNMKGSRPTQTAESSELGPRWLAPPLVWGCSMSDFSTRSHSLRTQEEPRRDGGRGTTKHAEILLGKIIFQCRLPEDLGKSRTQTRATDDRCGHSVGLFFSYLSLDEDGMACCLGNCPTW